MRRTLRHLRIRLVRRVTRQIRLELKQLERQTDLTLD